MLLETQTNGTCRDEVVWNRIYSEQGCSDKHVTCTLKPAAHIFIKLKHSLCDFTIAVCYIMIFKWFYYIEQSLKMVLKFLLCAMCQFRCFAV